MLILKPVIICIISLVIIIIVKSIMPSYVPAITIACGLIILIYFFPYLKNIFTSIQYFEIKSKTVSDTMKICIKITSISLLCDFASQLCIDNGHKYISNNIIFAGKIVILSILMPYTLQFFETIIRMLEMI